MRWSAKAWGLFALAIAAAVGIAVSVGGPGPSPASASTSIPAPAIDEPAAAKSTSETAVFAGGCFWGVQGVFQHVKGVTDATSGYAGGKASTAHYETVGTGETGHAESVRVTFDPNQVSFGQLLQVFFSVVHDPTELNRQGPDTGTQYRSAIFPQNDVQRRIAQAYISQLDQARVFGGPIVTRTDSDSGFFPAEGYHQNYLDLHPDSPYIAMNDMPKVDALKQQFGELYRDQPVLVAVSSDG
jgi:peptide-methionine (S)-S-oxide reductase